MSKNIPEVRFKGFSREWEEKKLGDVAEFNPKSNLPDKFQYVDLESVVGTQLLSKRTEYKHSAPSRAQRLAQKGDVFYQTVRPYQRNNYLYNLPYDNYVFSTGYAQLRPKIDSEFLLNVLQSDQVVSSVLDRCTGTSYPAINSKDLGEVIVKVPLVKEEQQKIGLIFKQVDDNITLQQQLIEQYQQYRKAMLQKMFPQKGERVPRIRFVFSGEWEEKTINEYIKTLKSGLSRMLSNTDIGLPVVRANNINEGRLDLKSEVKYWYRDDPQGANTSNYYIKQNDILINFINSEAKMGTATIVRNTPERDTIYTTNILNLRVNEKADPYYIYTLTTTSKYKYYIKSITKPAVNQASFTTVDFKKYKFLSPSKEEQQKIGSFFKQLDDTIALHEKRLANYQQFKKALLQRMFV